MPIYECYCPDCHRIFNFFSRVVNTTKRPDCPRCGRPRLERRMSRFAMVGGRGSDAESGLDEWPMDEAKMEQAVESLAEDARQLDENDPRQATALMRKFSAMTGMEYGETMQEALHRLERGEDPDQVEAELGDALESDEEPFLPPGRKRPASAARPPPARDPTLYEWS